MNIDWLGTESITKLRLGLLAGVGLCSLWMALGQVASAQAITTTTVQGTVYLANGQVAAGTLVLSWPAFTTAAGQSVAADSLTSTIATDGFVSVNLAPNQGATPAGLYYTAVYYLGDGTTNTQYWVVPAAANASLAQVQAQLMPAAQAVQTVSKAYVDQAILEASLSQLTATGGTLTGPLYLNGDPTQPLQAADKHYVDTTFAEAVPLSGGNMTGALQTPGVNGVESPVAGSSQATLQAAMTAAGTTAAMEIPPTYAGTDAFTNPNGVFVKDWRQGSTQQQERSVKEFGAVCDGVTDDTNALQSALAYANARGVALSIPQGTCKTRTLSWHGESIGGVGKQVSALMGFPGQDVLATAADSVSLLSYTRIHDLTIYVDQSVDVSCSAATGRASAGTCAVGRAMEKNSIFSPGGNGLTGALGTGAAWSVGNCAIAMPAATGAGGNGLRVAEIENVEIATTGVDPMAAQYPGAHSTHTCGSYLAQWPQWSEFRNIDIRGVNTGIAVPALPVATPAGLNSDSNRWQNITIQATHAFTAAAGSNNVLDNVVAMAGNSAATGEPPTGLVLDFAGTQQGWTVRNAVVLPMWDAVQPLLTVTALGGAVTGVALGSEHGLGLDPYGTQIPVVFSGSCSATAIATVNAAGAVSAVSVTLGGVGCSGTTTASLNVSGTWDTAAPVNLIAGQNMMLIAGNLLKGNGGYTVWNAASSQSNGTQLGGGGGSLPGGGTYAALVANNTVGTALQVDQFPGVDFGAKLQACLGAVSAIYGGTCDARNFTGTQSMGSSLTITTGNTAILLPCATISTANQVIVTAGTRNVSLRGCALRGGSAASGSQGGTAFLYSGTHAMVQVGDPTYAVDTSGFHLENVVINTTAASNATAQGVVAYRAQEMNLENLYFLGNPNQTGMTLDGTGNYTGGSFFGDQFSGFQTAVNAIGHQVANAATTDWLNASTFVRLHIDCPTSGGNPIAGTYGINLQQGDGNTFTGGDVEGCNTALHLGANAQNNTIVGLRNENSGSQIVADTGSSYNSWMTGGTIFTGKLTDNGTRNSFLDTFHRSFNGMNGDWYGSQQDATVVNHFRLGIGLGNERGLQDRYQTDFGYRWTMGLTDATAGEQFYQVLDELNNVNRLSIGQYNNGQSSTNNQTVVNAAGTGAVVLNGSNGSGTGGVVFGSGGATETTVATIDHAGDAQFNGTLQVAGVTQSNGTMTVRNGADAEVDYYLWPGLTTSQKGSFTYKDWNGNSQWYMLKDASNNWALNSATGALDSFKAYQSTNSGDTYVNASNPTGLVRINYETGAGAGLNIYGGSSTSLYASFTGTTAIKFPGLSATTGHNCVQIDNSGFITNTGVACGTGTGTGTVTSVGLSLPADLTVAGTPVIASGTLSATWANQTAGMFHAGPSTGVAATPTWRAIVAADIPTLNQATTANAGTATALAALPAQCTGSNYATGIAASGTANCAQVSYSQISGTPTAGASGTVNSGTTSQIAYYAANGTAVSGISVVPLTAGGTGATTAAGALTNVGAMAVAGGTMTGALTVRNSADAEVDYLLWPGLTTSQKGSFTYKDWNGTSEWYLLKDASNNWSLNSAIGGLDSFKAYQSTNSGDTYLNASNSTGVVRVNYETGAGTAFNIYGGSSSSLYASFTGTTSIKFPGLAATSGHSCVQIDNSGYITNTGVVCGTGTGNGTVTSVGLSLPADLTVAGTPVTASGTLSATWANESAGMFHAGPSTGVAATPTWRSIVAADIPTLNQATTANAGTATALATVPGQCTGSNYATGIGASGTANCAQVAYSQISGTPTVGASGTVNSGTTSQIAYYAANGTTVGGLTSVPLAAGGTGATTAAAALTSLGAQAAIAGLATDGLSGITVSAKGTFGGGVTATTVTAQNLPNNILNVSQYGVLGNGTNQASALQTVANLCGSGKSLYFPPPASVYYSATQIAIPDGCTVFGEHALSLVNIGFKLGDHTRLRDLTFQANSTASSAYILSNAAGTAAVTDVEISGNIFNNIGTALYIDIPPSNGTNGGIYFHGNQCLLDNACVYAVRVQASLFDNNLVNMGTVTTGITSYVGFYFGADTKSTISNNTMHGNGVGIAGILHLSRNDINSASANPWMYGNHVDGNKIDGMTQESISFDLFGNNAQAMAVQAQDTIASLAVTGGNYNIGPTAAGVSTSVSGASYTGSSAPYTQTIVTATALSASVGQGISLEIPGYLGTSTIPVVCTVTAIGGTTVTCTETVTPSASSSSSGAIVVGYPNAFANGAWLVMLSGNAKGTYFQILNSTMSTLTLSLPSVTEWSALSPGDQFLIGYPFLKNSVTNNEIDSTLGTYGIGIHGFGYDNTIANNHCIGSNKVLSLSGDLTQGTCISVQSLNGLTNAGGITMPLGGRAAPAEKNTMVGNTSVGGNNQLLYYSYAPGTAQDFVSKGNKWTGNILNGANFSSSSSVTGFNAFVYELDSSIIDPTASTPSSACSANSLGRFSIYNPTAAVSATYQCQQTGTATLASTATGLTGSSGVATFTPSGSWPSALTFGSTCAISGSSVSGFNVGNAIVVPSGTPTYSSFTFPSATSGTTTTAATCTYATFGWVATNLPVLPVASGGTGTATPGLVSGTNVSVSGSWPNQTVTAANQTKTNVWSNAIDYLLTSAGSAEGFSVPFANAATLTRFQLYTATAGAGCSTAPVMAVRDLTTSTNLATMTLANGTATFDSGVLSGAIVSGHTIQLYISTPSIGCSTQWAGLRYMIQYTQ